MTAIAGKPMPLFGVYGAGGCGRGVIPIADRMLRESYGGAAFKLVFIDDAAKPSVINGRRVLSVRDFLDEPASVRAVAIAIAEAKARSRIAQVCTEGGLASFSITAPGVVVMDDVEIGEGAILSPFVTLTSNIRIGRHFHCNVNSYVEHDCVIGDFVTFAPGVHCNGNVRIEDHAYLGSGCILRQGRPGAPLVIGEGAVVGMGAVVTESVAAGTTVVGNPARVLRWE